MKITLRAARVNAGLTRQEAAKKIGVTFMSIANWEKGKAIKRKHLEKLLEVYGVKIENVKLEYEETITKNKIV